jgi:uncharacterized damage-inducible protein DinB
MATVIQSARDQFLTALEMESATTLKVLRAYPQDKSELRPAPVLKTARELAWIFVMEQAVGVAVLRNQLTLPPAAPPPAPATLAEVIDAFEQGVEQLKEVLRSTSEDELHSTFRFYVAPKTEGDVPKIRFLWMMLCDQIHHRGQFSIYTRIAGGVVPSIYGPTLEQPWF